MCFTCDSLNITWQVKISNKAVLHQASILSMFTLLKQRHLRWLSHVVRMDIGRLVVRQACWWALDPVEGLMSDTRTSVSAILWPWTLTLIPGRPLIDTELSGNVPSLRVSQVLRPHYWPIWRPEESTMDHNPNPALQFTCGKCGRVCNLRIGHYIHNRCC